jgi:hypothetical protein
MAVKFLKRVGLLIQDKLPHEKSLIKAQEMAKTQVRHFTLDEYTVTILGQPREENGLLAVDVNATRNGQHVKVDNPLYFKNPPILVEEGDDFVEDIDRAFQQIIVNTLRTIK